MPSIDEQLNFIRQEVATKCRRVSEICMSTQAEGGDIMDQAELIAAAAEDPDVAKKLNAILMLEMMQIADGVRPARVVATMPVEPDNAGERSARAKLQVDVRKHIIEKLEGKGKDNNTAKEMSKDDIKALIEKGMDRIALANLAKDNAERNPYSAYALDVHALHRRNPVTYTAVQVSEVDFEDATDDNLAY